MPDHIENTTKFETSGSNQSGMRDRNERLVLSILRREGALPKAEIARKTGLSAQTVSVIMRALEGDGLLMRGEKVRGRIGQPSIPMALAPEGAYFLGLKVGRRSLELILVDFVGAEVAHVAETHDFPAPQRTLAFTERALKEVCSNLTPEQIGRISGLGIAMPFYLWEWAAVIGVEENKMAAWKDCDLQAEVAAMVDYPVYLGNDATCACGAELVFGDTETPPDFLYIYMGYFVGGGTVLNGALYTGSRGNAGAVGPFPILDRNGRERQLVDVASLIGLERRLKAASEDSSHMWDALPSWNFDERIIEDWLAESIPAIARTAVSALSVIDFSAILIDGYLPEAYRDVILDRVKDDFAKQNQSGVAPTQILSGSVGPRARALGAASLPLSARFMV